jgi:Bacterial Ig-like domain
VVSSWSAPLVSAVQRLFRVASGPRVHDGCDARPQPDSLPRIFFSVEQDQSSVPCPYQCIISRCLLCSLVLHTAKVLLNRLQRHRTEGQLGGSFGVRHIPSPQPRSMRPAKVLPAGVGLPRRAGSKGRPAPPTPASGRSELGGRTWRRRSDGLKATLNPFGARTTQLARNTKYKGVLTMGTKDLAGNSLAQHRSWTFTTKQ